MSSEDRLSFHVDSTPGGAASDDRISLRIDSSPESAEEARRKYVHHHRHGIGEKRRISELDEPGGAGPAVKRINVNIGKVGLVCTTLAWPVDYHVLVCVASWLAAVLNGLP